MSTDLNALIGFKMARCQCPRRIVDPLKKMLPLKQHPPVIDNQGKILDPLKKNASPQTTSTDH
jgi:hypothetical protein